MFIALILCVGFIGLGWILTDIKIELRYKNILLEKQNEILKTKTS